MKTEKTGAAKGTRRRLNKMQRQVEQLNPLNRAAKQQKTLEAAFRAIAALRTRVSKLEKVVAPNPS